MYDVCSAWIVRNIDLCQLAAERVVRIILALGYAAINSGAKQAAGMSVTACMDQQSFKLGGLKWRLTSYSPSI